MKQKLAILAVVVAVAVIGCWTALAGNNPEVREVDIDVDSDYNGVIEAADDGIEVSAGGFVPYGGWTNITIKQTISDAQPGDLNTVRLSWLREQFLLSETSGGPEIADGVLPNGRYYKDYPGLNMTKTLWVQGVWCYTVTDSDSVGSIILELQHYSDTYIKSYDMIKMSVLSVDSIDVWDGDDRHAADGVLQIVPPLSNEDLNGKATMNVDVAPPEGYPEWSLGGVTKTGLDVAG